MKCPICGAVKEWENCPSCEGEGGYFLNNDWIQCDSCDGEEGWFICPEQDKHARALEATDLKSATNPPAT